MGWKKRQYLNNPGDNNTTPPDTTAPNNITNLTTSNLSNTGVTISWTASTSSDVGSYQIYNGEVNIGQTLNTTFTIEGLTEGTEYVLTVKAKDNNSNYSSGVSVTLTTPEDLIAFATPNGCVFDDSQIISLQSNKDSDIHYTLDGTAPTTSSAKYSAPFTITSSKILRFFARDSWTGETSVSKKVNFVKARTIVSKDDVDFSSTGTWSTSSTALGYNGGTTLFSTTSGNTATWKTRINKTGAYDVFIWLPISGGNTTSATYEINNAGVITSVTISQMAKLGEWQKLTTVNATENTDLSVKYTTGSEAGTKRVDAARFVYTSTNIFVNQSGYDIGKPKRATINEPDGTIFDVKEIDGSTVYSGFIKNGVADFSKFNPHGYGKYYIECKDGQSSIFSIGRYLMQSVSIDPALLFMNESRQDKFNRGGSTGYAWRDSHQFSFELNTLVLQYMANPSAYNRMPYGIRHLDNTDYTVMVPQTKPDIIWLMEFGARRYHALKTVNGNDLNGLVKGQLAYFLFIYPEISQYIDSAFYTQIRDFAIQEWSNINSTLDWYEVGDGTDNSLFEVQRFIGDIKGAKPPGYKIIPNLMMYEVLKRDGLPNYQTYFDAAYNNCEWLINNVNLNLPINTKGQRMSEHITVTALAYFYELYPTSAPPGLLSKIEQWVDLMIKRSNNLWDLRKYADPSDGTGTLNQWTGGYNNPTSPMNEPGNLAGFMAPAYAARRVISNIANKGRLQEIAISQIDHVFGRNPLGRHSTHNGLDEIKGVDVGWKTFYKGGLGALEDVPGVLDGAPKESAYPYNTTADPGYTEGWVAFNTAWNVSLAYSAADDVNLKVYDSTFTNELSSTTSGSTIGIRLKAPLNFNENAVETGEVVISLSDGTTSKLQVSEESNDSFYFRNTYVIPSGKTYVDVSYGIGIFKKTIRITIV